MRSAPVVPTASDAPVPKVKPPVAATEKLVNDVPEQEKAPLITMVSAEIDGVAAEFKQASVELVANVTSSKV